jgi:ATP-dependent protease ClpP protease subunit
MPVYGLIFRPKVFRFSFRPLRKDATMPKPSPINIALPNRSHHAPPAAQPRGLTVKAAAAEDPEILIYDEIGPGWLGLIDGDSVVRALKSLPVGHQRVVVRINSVGGSVFEAFAIYNALVRHPTPIAVEIDAIAASAASVVAMAGDRIRIAQNAMMMIHQAWTIAWGNKEELAQTVVLLEKIDESIVATYAARADQPADDVRAWLEAETWFTADEAVEKGFADEIGQELQVKASVPAGRFKNVPQKLRESGERRAESGEPESGVEGQGAGVSVLREQIALARRRLGV